MATTQELTEWANAKLGEKLKFKNRIATIISYNLGVKHGGAWFLLDKDCVQRYIKYKERS